MADKYHLKFSKKNIWRKWKREILNDLNTAVFTTKYVLNNNSPILYVYHYKEDGAWTFLGIESLIDEDYRVVPLEEIFNIDSSILKIVSLELGYCACRKSREAKWIAKNL